MAATTIPTYVPKHMAPKAPEPKAAPKLDYEQAWRIVYAAECIAVGTPNHKAIKDARESLERLMEPKAAPKAKPDKAPKAKAARKSTTMPEAPAGWWNEWFDKPWVKHGRVKASSSIVKLVAEGGHGAELRAAGWQYSKKAFTKPDGKKVAGFWWAYKDADRAKERGERYLANKAARQAEQATC